MNNNSTNNQWNINLVRERDLISKNILGSFILKPETCPFCQIGIIGIIKKESEFNPIQFKCNNYKCCRNIPIRNNTIFQFNPRTPISVLYNIMKFWLIDEFNVSKISTKIEDIYMKKKVDRRFIYNFIFNLRKIIATYLRNVYCLERLASNNANQTLCVDESLFTHTDGAQTWVVGILNINTDEVRLEVVTDRSENTLKTIIQKHVGIGNTIYSDSWAGYNFLNREDSGYIHNMVNHNHGIFGLTSKIEGVWGEIKSIIKKMYSCIHSKNFIYFLREAEYRRSLRKLNIVDKLDDFGKIASSVEYDNFPSEENLLEIDYEACFDD